MASVSWYAYTAAEMEGTCFNFLVGLLYDLSVFDMFFWGFCVSEFSYFWGECLQNVLIGFFMPLQM